MVRLKTYKRNGAKYVKLFHSTSEDAAISIMASGFRDRKYALSDISGVFFSDRPLNAADDVAKHSNVIIEIECTLPLVELRNNYELREQGRPAESYREWLIPSEIVNPMNRYIFVEDE